MSIASELSRLLQAKSDLATSIENKGVTVPASATLDDYPALVDSISGGVTPVPYDSLVSYLQGDGTAYIDTGIKASSNINFRVVVEVLSTFPSTGQAVLGSRVANNNAALTLQYYKNSSAKYWRFAFGNNQITADHAGTTGTYNVSNLDRANVIITTGAKTLAAQATNSTFSNDLNMYLFTMNTGGSVAGLEGNAYLRIKACMIFDSYNLVRDYVPARKNGVGYLYDKVSGQLFGNANSTGAFTYGSDVGT